METIKEAGVYILDRTNHKIHYFTDCKKIGSDSSRILSEDYHKEFLTPEWRYADVRVCESCGNKAAAQFGVMLRGMTTLVWRLTFLSLIQGERDEEDHPLYLWLVSPMGRTYKLPYKQALRVARKHDWDFAEVTPKSYRWQRAKSWLSTWLPVKILARIEK